jgi:hypothetical protein
MSELDHSYARLLQVGFLVLNQAFESGNQDWVRAEIEMLHNIPSLLGDENIKRHQHYWTAEREHYLDWLARHGSAEARSRMRTYYEPIWAELASLVGPLEHLKS